MTTPLTPERLAEIRRYDFAKLFPDASDNPLAWALEHVRRDLLAEVDRLTALTASCTCPDSPMTYAGPEVDCPVHGAVRALSEAIAERDRLQGWLTKAEKIISEVANSDPDATEDLIQDLRERAETAEAVVARAENLRDKWLSWPPGSEHHAAGLMLACYLDGTAYGSDEPRPDTPVPAPSATVERSGPVPGVPGPTQSARATTAPLRQRATEAATAVWQREAIVCEHTRRIPIGDLVDAVLAVADDEMEQLRQRADLLDEECGSLRQQLTAIRMEMNGLRREATTVAVQRDNARTSHQLQQQMTMTQVRAREEAEAILRDLVNGPPCTHEDVHGHWQASVCPYSRARDLLRTLDGDGSTP